MWFEKCSWDEKVQADVERDFTKWFSEIDFLRQCKIPGWFSSLTYSNDNSIHVFADASQKAFGVCIFFRAVMNGEVHINLIQAKARISPQKPASIPRLELLACCMAVRLWNSIAESFEGIPIYFWTDSEVCLCWIQKPDIWKPFIKNRVREILLGSKVENWRHVPGFLNPADLLSRGCSPKALFKTKWWLGPDWLKKDKMFWPKENFSTSLSNERNVLIACCMDTNYEESMFCDSLFTYFSSFSKIVLSFAWLLRFIKNCRSAMKTAPILSPRS